MSHNEKTQTLGQGKWSSNMTQQGPPCRRGEQNCHPDPKRDQVDPSANVQSFSRVRRRTHRQSATTVLKGNDRSTVDRRPCHTWYPRVLLGEGEVGVGTKDHRGI